jgi:hypothetical protein
MLASQNGNKTKRREHAMKSFSIKVSACLIFCFISIAAYAEERAMNNDKPRDCSSITDAKKKARCEAFNKALKECKSEGKKVGKELDACLEEKGKKPVQGK